MFCPKFSAPLAASDANIFSKCKNGTDLLYHHTKFGGARISRTGGGGGEKFNAFNSSCANRIRRYFGHSMGDFEVSRPTGATRSTDGVKFGVEKSIKGRHIIAKFYPHR